MRWAVDTAIEEVCQENDAEGMLRRSSVGIGIDSSGPDLPPRELLNYAPTTCGSAADGGLMCCEEDGFIGVIRRKDVMK